MEIREIDDKVLWESFIQEHSPQALFQSWNWGETVKEYQKSKIKSQILWRMGLYHDDELVGIAQIEKVFAKRGKFLHIRHGPVFSSWGKKYLDYFVKYLTNKANEEKVIFIRISPLVENNTENKDLLKKYGFRDAQIHAMDGEYCWVLDLNKSHEALLSGMRKTTRYLIRQAIKMGVEIQKSENREDILPFLKLYKETASRQNFVEHKGIPEEFDAFLKDGQILLFKGKFKNRLLSAALIIFYNHQAIYHHSASIEQKIPVNYLLQWEAIQEAKKRGLAIYNFFGIAPENNNRHPWLGLTLFKKGFGGRKVEYLHSQDLPLSFRYCTTFIVEKLRKIKKGY